MSGGSSLKNPKNCQCIGRHREEFYTFACLIQKTIFKTSKMRKIKEMRIVLSMALIALMGMNLSACFDPVSNEYRVTVPTFATVTKNEAGKVRLYLDENRGILEPNAKSEAVDWGDAVRVRIMYDLPMVSGSTTSMENLRFSTPLRSAVKVDTVQMVDITDKGCMLPTDTLLAFNVQAYRGYVTMQVWNGNNFDFDMTCSYDRKTFDGENLYLNLHYKEGDGVWMKDFYQTVSAPFPSFLTEPGVVTSDSLKVHLIAPVWYRAGRDSAYVDTVTCKISRYRLEQPTY